MLGRGVRDKRTKEESDVEDRKGGREERDGKGR